MVNLILFIINLYRMLWHFLRFVTDNVRYFMCLFLVRNCHLIDLKKFDVSLMRISSASFFRSRLFLFFFLLFFTWWNWWDFSMLVKIHFSWKDRNVLSILLLNQNLVVSLCRSFSFQCEMLMVEIKDVDFVISIETGPCLFWFSPWFFGSVYFS